MCHIQVTNSETVSLGNENGGDRMETGCDKIYLDRILVPYMYYGEYFHEGSKLQTKWCAVAKTLKWKAVCFLFSIRKQDF